jgi:hypothetical protein
MTRAGNLNSTELRQVGVKIRGGNNQQGDMTEN